MCRGYYTRSYLWAVDFDGKKLTTKWLHASPVVAQQLVEITLHKLLVDFISTSIEERHHEDVEEAPVLCHGRSVGIALHHGVQSVTRLLWEWVPNGLSTNEEAYAKCTKLHKVLARSPVAPMTDELLTTRCNEKSQLTAVVVNKSDAVDGDG